MTPALIAALVEAGIKIEPEIVALFVAIFHHKNKPAAAVAAKATVDALDDRITNDPSSPYFVE